MDIINGKIYALKRFQTDKIYIGSTIQSLNIRLNKHKSDFVRYKKGIYHYKSSFEIAKFDDCYIELIKEVCCTKKQLLILEGEEIENNKNKVNIRIEGEVHRQLHEIEYRKNNQEHRKQYQIEYLKDDEHKQRSKEQKKKWMIENREKFNAYKKQWRAKRKELGLKY